jgi:hypothetical protein
MNRIANVRIENATTRQQGMTIIAVLLIFIIIAFIALLAMRIVPIYLDYFNIKSTLESIKKEPGVEQWSAYDIQTGIQRRFDIGYVDIIKAKDIKIRRQGNDRILQLIYEDRRPLIGNLDIIAKFNDTVVLSQ